MITSARRDRKCQQCKSVLKNSRTLSIICRLCAEANTRCKIIEREYQDITAWGYVKLEGPWVDKFNHRCYKVLTPCGHEWSAPYPNIRKQVKNARLKNLRPACGVCGPQHRMKAALKGYIEEHGIDYDLTKANEYRRKVRGLTEVTYKNNKHLINPNNLPRGRNSGYHVDHVVPIIECFKQGWTPEKTASVSNLQMLPWADNLSKGSS